MELAALHLDKSFRPSGKPLRKHPAFCHVCTNFDSEVAFELYVPAWGEGLWIDRKTHSVMSTFTMRELTETADAGCASCTVLKVTAETLGHGTFDPNSDDELTVTYWDKTTMTFQLGDYTSKDHVIELFTLPGEPCPWSTIGNEVVAVDPSLETWRNPGGQASIITQKPLSNESMAKIKEWIEKCKSDHPYCNIRSSAQVVGSYPKRLIYVGYDDSETRLVRTDNMATGYAALSYCWGDSVGINLTTENEQMLSQSLPVKDLLQTHQDAISITRKLGLLYLWTDGLCIRQNDMSEKAVEIAKMDSVYTNAYMTIAGTSSKQADDGCLQQRAQTFKMPIVDADGNISYIYARRAIPHTVWDWGASDAFSPAARNLSVDDPSTAVTFPLFSRGWTFQERLLTSRMLHFTKHEIVWECLGMTCCECGTLDDFVGNRVLRERRYALGVPQDIEIRCGKLERSRRLAARLGLLDNGKWAERMLTSEIQNDYALMYTIRGQEYTGDENPIRERNTHWRDLITQYSRRVLRYDTDALPAISGLAKAWVTSLPSPPEYLAGIWADDLHRGLLWTCIDANPKDRPTQYLAPTWSWASIRRIIDWLPTNPTETTQPIYHITIHHAICHPSSPSTNPYGEVQPDDSGGNNSISITGSLVKVTITSLNEDTSTAFASLDPESPESHHNAFIADCIPELRDMIDQHVYCLWWSTDVNDARTNMGWERALVLKEKNKKGHGENEEPHEMIFTRVGIMQHFPVDIWREFLEEERTLTIF